MPFTVTAAKEGIVPPGTYSAVLEKVEVRTITSAFGTNEMRDWSFLLDVNGELQPLSALTTLNTSPQSKSYRWLAALLRRPLLSGETLADPIGQRCLVTVESNAKGYSKVVDIAPIAEPESIIPGVPR